MSPRRRMPRMMLLATAVLAAVTAAAQPPPAQVQQQTQQIQQRAPARDQSQAANKGTGILRGKVVNTEGRPLRRVQVAISGETIPGGRTASTNGLGKWEIAELPAGRFNLIATRAGYLPAQ